MMMPKYYICNCDFHRILVLVRTCLISAREQTNFIVHGSLPGMYKDQEDKKTQNCSDGLDA